MKKLLFLGISFLFAGVLFWQISYFDFSQFHFYGLIDEIFSITHKSPSLYFDKYIPSLLLMGVYTISLVYVALLYKKKFSLLIALLFAELILYTLLPTLSFIFIGMAFALGSLMLFVQVTQQHKVSVKLNFFDLTYRGINQFVRYALIILCLYNFVLIKNQPFMIPVSALNSVVNQLEKSFFEALPLNAGNNSNQAIDFNEKLCDREGVDTNACLKQLAQFMQTENLHEVASRLGHVSPTEINLSEIINLKFREIIEPYQMYLPYVLTIVFFSPLYFILTFLVFIYAFLGAFIHVLLRKIKLIRIDLREVPQEYLT